MTIVCFEHKFIFIKAKKVASTSVEAFLRQWTSVGDIVTPLTPRDEKWCADRGRVSMSYAADREAEREYISLCQASNFDAALQYIKEVKRTYVSHMPAHKIKKLLEQSGYRWEDFYSFTVERHPYSWLLSVMLYDNDSYHSAGGCSIDLSDINKRAVEFVESEGYAERLNAKYYAQDGRLLVNDVLHYENLHDDLVRVLTPLVGAPDLSDFPFLKKNASHLSPQDIFEPETLDLIRYKSRQVLELAGYEN